MHSDLEIEQHPLHIMSTRKAFAHCNSCAELPDGNLLLSFRRISTLMIVEKSSKKVKWYNANNEWDSNTMRGCSLTAIYYYSLTGYMYQEGYFILE